MAAHERPDEREQLLGEERQDRVGRKTSGEIEDQRERDEEDARERSTVGETLHLIGRALPVSAAYLLQSTLPATCVLTVSRIGTDELSAASQSFGLSSLAFCVAHGGTTALDTLASSIYTSKTADRTMVGVLLQRCLIVQLLLYLPFALVYFFLAEDLLVALKQPPMLAANVQLFMRAFVFGIPGYLMFESIKKYWQALGIMHAATCVLAITAPLNVALNHLFVRRFGLIGAAVATGTTFYLSSALLALAIPFTRARSCWGGFDRRAFSHIPAFLKLAIPGAIQLITEWLALFIVALGAGRLGRTSLAAQSVVQTLDQLIFTLPLGQGSAATSHIGNLLGAGKPRQAKRSARISLVLGIAGGALVLAVLMIARTHIGQLFTDDRQVIDEVSRVLIPVALFQIADGINMPSCGVIRACARQDLAAGFSFVAFYVFGLPTGFLLAFHFKLGLSGLWTGSAVCLWVVGLLQMLYVARLDFEREAELAARRNEANESTSVG